MFKNAACLGQPTTWWFPEKNGKSGDELREIFFNTRKATAICRECPCLFECMKYSLDNYEVGIWGGMGEKLRKQARRMYEKGESLDYIAKKLLRISQH